ncbi:phosphatidyl synthase [Spathaspora passalidarum NRRL Y-27907]|uniref:Phosphatidyl synthase n=1 Tax=Spathaspora passalidarum (strain NRRL Y-27907 / 11-Y1) TaxID=619300 RepID=G3APM2_SPAPN|nr:phosphatidyl synthase [Spathaspora passalidarum NRRL Y-27907]EGW32193.1 phosphatidyl synthase [Spathaspora passalidarum NRRL Y-27907]
MSNGNFIVQEDGAASDSAIDSAPGSASGSALASPKFQSYLNNDGIDELQPSLRKHRVSNLSLSDLNQWQTGLHKLTSSPSLSNKGSSTNLKKVDSLAKLSRNSSIIRRKKKAVIDHERVASYAFCFDIDGVILRGPDTIPQAVDAIKLLNGENKYNIKVPYVFVTNGGGKPEKQRADDLSRRLQTTITEDQIIQGHTPMKDLVDVYDTVLVVGGVGNTCRRVAESYGFKNVYTPLDIMKWNPAVSPYHDLTTDEIACCKDVDFSKIKIQAILVFADSRNWAVDQQIILELLLSKDGVMGTESQTYHDGPEIYFAHSDFIWATNYKLSRYGMGALQVSIAALYREHTGQELKVNRFGKPQKGTFKFANKVLTHWRQGVLDEHLKKLSIHDPNASQADILINEEGEEIINQSKLESYHYSDSDDDTDDEINKVVGKREQKTDKITLELPPASTVYFVGDTPESDIRFANSHDSSWHSILVKTGVYQEGTVPKYKPKHMCDNVLEAVKYAIEREHAKELEEWNETAVDDEASSAKINFSDLVMTPSDTQESKKSEKSEKSVASVDELETVEVPGILSEQISKVKDIKVHSNLRNEAQ